MKQGAERLLEPEDWDGCCEIASSQQDRALLLKPQKHGCLNKTQIMTTQVSMPVRLEKTLWGPILR